VNEATPTDGFHGENRTFFSIKILIITATNGCSNLAVMIILKNFYDLFSKILAENRMLSVITKLPLNSCITSQPMQCE
jgi:hypothetical protein